MPATLFDLHGKRALITGAGRGLGLAMARGFGQAGATVILNDLAADRLEQAVAALAGEGLAAHGSCFDVSNAEAVRREVPALLRRIGPVDILVNNAGIHRRAPLEELEEAAWQEVLNTNLSGAFYVAKQVVPGMIGRRAGKIINICSVMSEVGRPTVAPYMASKGGLKMLTKAMALEWARHNIQVNGIGPTWMATELNRPLMDDPEFDAFVRRRVPAGRWGDPRDMVGTAVYLASAASDFVTGQVIYLDGGTLSAL
ncbi:MAG: glucose 1-dehydrogenase [Candidatus Methylomirabilota bacterium]